jgi:hypothetical protein
MWNPAKAFSVRQPWSYLICAGIKPIENRTWWTNLKGRYLVHAGAQYDSRHRDMSQLFTPEQWECMRVKGGILDKMLYSPFDRSSIIGSVEIIDCVRNYSSIWAEKETHIDRFFGKPMWNWVLANPILFEKPILNVKGRLSFFVPEIPEN